MPGAQPLAAKATWAMVTAAEVGMEEGGWGRGKGDNEEASRKGGGVGMQD